MKVNQITIEGYRSLYHVELQPRSFTTIVGPNNAGKSNLLDAIHFLGEVHKHGIDVAISRKGGFENIAFRHIRRSKRPITFRVSAELDSDDIARIRYTRRESPKRTRLLIEHSFAIGAASQAIDADFYVVQESLSLKLLGTRRKLIPSVTAVRTRQNQHDEIDFQVVGLSNTRGTSITELLDPFNDTGFLEFVQRTTKPGQLMLTSMRYNDALAQFGQALSATNLHQLAPIECRKPGVPTPVPELELHGGNLPALVEFLQKHQTAAWDQVLNAMRKVVPNLGNVKTVYTTDRRLALVFAEEDYGRPWSSEDISDGTIQSLAMFCALFDPRSRITLIEEPENSVHPWIIRVFADACRSITNKTVIVTTHSPVLLNHLSPEEVMVAFRSDGRTHLAGMAELDPEAPQLWSTGVNTVFEMLDSGWLPEAVPGQ